MLDADELTGKVHLRLKRSMKALRLADKVRIKRADDDASVFRLRIMMTDEMLAVERQNGAPFARSNSQ